MCLNSITISGTLARPEADDAARLLDVVPDREPVDPVLVRQADVEAATPQAISNDEGVAGEAV